MGFSISLRTISGTGGPALGEGGAAAHTTMTELFPKVDPLVDGEDCEHDCGSFVAALPRNFKINEVDYMYGRVKAWNAHFLVATGKSDWAKVVVGEKGSVMEAIDKTAIMMPTSGVSIPLKSLTTCVYWRMLTLFLGHSCYLL